MYDNIYMKLGGLYMVNVIRLSLFLIAISLFFTGCTNSKESEEQELINIIESVEKNKPTMSDEERYDLRTDILH